jgi:DNA repair protein RecN (Recombination protein N)
MGLRRISLKDFVIVQALELDFSHGFSALTGETGAGKSILIDALQLCLGARADAGTVREGASRTEVWAEFDAPAVQSALSLWLDDGGFETQDLLLLRRSVDKEGKSRAWINGSPATATQLRELGDQLVDIHGQHAWAALTRSQDIRQLLDGYAGIATQAMAQAYTQWRDAQKTLETAQSQQAQLQTERERLSWQLGELQKLSPAEDEWAEINIQHTRLANAQALIDASQLALAQLDHDEGGALTALSKAHSTLQDLQDTEPAFAAIAEELASSLTTAEDAAHSLQAYLRKTDLDPERLAELDQRISDWMGLARRFRRTPEELPQVQQAWKADLAQLDTATDLDALSAQVKRAQAAYDKEAKAVSRARQAAAPKLSRAVSAAMQSLGMEGGQFVVNLAPLAQGTSAGWEEVQFLVAGHAGSSPKPIGKVASGGELSRIALALSVVTNETGTAPTVIFDEVDAGVGGAVAESVGRLMRKLGQQRQVMAVTHLPQVASYAHQHFLVSKAKAGDQTISQVNSLSPTDREKEIARMLGGEVISETSLAHAREMLDRGALP